MSVNLAPQLPGLTLGHVRYWRKADISEMLYDEDGRL